MTITTRYINDLPVQNESDDKLDFEDYSKIFANLIKSQSNHAPLTIGIFGGWGTGKTSLMRMLQKRLKSVEEQSEEKTEYLTVWFDAWKYDKENDLWRSLLLHVLAEVRKAIENNPDKNKAEKNEDIQELEDIAVSLYHPIEREELGDLKVDWRQLLKGSLETATHVGLSLIPGLSIIKDIVESSADPGLLLKALEREKTKIYVNHIQSLEQFQDKFQSLVKKSLSYKGEDDKDHIGKLIIFIDDLDRCLPEKAISVLETIKVFLDVEDCVFVLGVDPAIISYAIELKYGVPEIIDEQKQQQVKLNGIHYLEKIIQVPFQIPAMEREQVKVFVNSLLEKGTLLNKAEYKNDKNSCVEIFALGLGNNPRQIKRAVNTFLLLLELSITKGANNIKSGQLAKLVIIQNSFPELYEIFKQEPDLLGALENYYLESKKGVNEKRTDKDSRLALPPSLSYYKQNDILRRLFTMEGDENGLLFTSLPQTDLNSYFTLVGRTESPKIYRTKPEIKNILLPEMILVENVDGKFWVGKYPIKEIEYLSFLSDTLYQLSSDNFNSDSDKANHPKVSISWNEAKAYCDWLSEKTGDVYRLPTIQEWMFAAKGDTNNKYPWGNKWNKNKANTKESFLGETTLVGSFSPKGDSPSGCADMVGNVWEWCNDYRNSEIKEYKICLGGSYNSAGKEYDRESWDGPDAASADLGFRVVRDFKPREK